MNQTITPRYVARYSHATDGLISASFLARQQTFDFEAAVADWLREQVSAGRAAIRPYGNSRSTGYGYHLRTGSGWRALAIRNRRGGGAHSPLLGRTLVACAA